MSLQIETAQNVGVDYEIASIGERIAAQLIDYLVYLTWAFIITIAFAALNFKGSVISSNWILTGGILLPVMLCPLVSEYFFNGQTIGKMAMKIRVVSIDGGKASLSAYLFRWLLSIIDISIFSGLVAILTIILNGKGQRVGDIAAGTSVIKTNPTIRLNQIISPEMDPGYQPSYPNVTVLSDKDIATIRKVLASENEELQDAAMSRIEDLLKVHSLETAEVFLSTVINDYHYFITLETT